MKKPEPEKMVLQVSLITSDYRGDHATDIVKAIEVNEDMTIKQLAEKLLRESTFSSISVKDHIEIRACHKII